MDSDKGYIKGKWGQRGRLQNPSNVTRIARAISAEDDVHHPQVVYYQAGIGTGIGLASQILGGGTGLGLEENIREAYSFLASNYRERDEEERKIVPPDSIFLVGFSRGAYTARSIAGLIGALGLLKKPAMAHFYEIFSDWIHAGDNSYTPLFFDSYLSRHKNEMKMEGPSLKLARDRTRIDQYLQEYFTKLECMNLTQEVRINCIGVFDTVGSLGVPVNPVIQALLPFLPSYVRDYRWFDTRIDSHIDNAFHALALDERRYPFSPTLWESRPGCHTKLKQVWFPGSHSNVGGSYEDTGIADITLAWMMDQLAGNTTHHPDGFEHRDWIKFDDDYLSQWTDCDQDPSEKTTRNIYKGWAMGKLYNSCYFPTSLGGTRTREPGRYHGTFYETGKVDSGRLLERTEERMHASVRARIDLGGRDVETDWNQVFPNGMSVWPLIVYYWRRLTRRAPKLYRPHKSGPLKGWKLLDGHESHKEPNYNIDMSPVESRQIKWIYSGSEPSSSKSMLEDKLGPFELQLLQRDQRFADQLMVSNNRWNWSINTRQHSPRRGHTM
jgi:uncharacterized protein (DUF2235 family)